MLKSQEKLIAEIHDEFDTAQDRLLQQAREIIDNTVPDHPSPMEEIADRLIGAGFTNTPLVKTAAVIKVDKEKKREKLVRTREQAELIQYYKMTYPFIKFLTEDELNRICDKYELIHAPVNNYIKDVPEKNLRDIENAQVLRGTDSPEQITLFSGKVWCSHDHKELTVVLKNRCNDLKNVPFKRIPELPRSNVEYTFISEETRDALGILKSLGISTGGVRQHIWLDGTIDTVKRSGLFIAAPESHFDLTGSYKKSKHGFFEVFRTEVKDPIVFRYVRGGVQVLTKWGLEAEDPSLLLPINN